RKPRSTAAAGSSGVDRTLCTRSAPPTKAIRSVNVPPVSTPTMAGGGFTIPDSCLEIRADTLRQAQGERKLDLAGGEGAGCDSGSIEGSVLQPSRGWRPARRLSEAAQAAAASVDLAAFEGGESLVLPLLSDLVSDLLSDLPSDLLSDLLSD